MIFGADLIAKGLVIAGVVAGVVWYLHTRDLAQQAIGRNAATAEYNRQLAVQNQTAEALQARLTAQKDSLEQTLQQLKQDQEVISAKNRNTVASLQRQYNALRAANNGRLRDPYATPAPTGCGPGGERPTAPATAFAGVSVDHGAQAPGLLSAELTEFLQQKDETADAINLAYTDCRAYTIKLRSLLHPQPAQ